MQRQFIQFFEIEIACNCNQLQKVSWAFLIKFNTFHALWLRAAVIWNTEGIDQQPKIYLVWQCSQKTNSNKLNETTCLTLTWKREIWRLFLKSPKTVQVPQFPLYLCKAKVLSHPLGFSYIKNMLKYRLFKTGGLQFDNWLLQWTPKSSKDFWETGPRNLSITSAFCH